METTLTVQQVVNNVVQTVAFVAPLAGIGTFGVTEFAKKVGLSGRWAGIFAFVIGFFITILVMKITGGGWFSPLGILVGILVACGTPGAYSVVKSALSKSEPTQ